MSFTKLTVGQNIPVLASRSVQIYAFLLLLSTWFILLHLFLFVFVCVTLCVCVCVCFGWWVVEGEWGGGGGLRLLQTQSDVGTEP